MNILTTAVKLTGVVVSDVEQEVGDVVVTVVRIVLHHALNAQYSEQQQIIRN